MCQNSEVIAKQRCRKRVCSTKGKKERRGREERREEGRQKEGGVKDGGVNLHHCSLLGRVNIPLPITVISLQCIVLTLP